MFVPFGGTRRAKARDFVPRSNRSAAVALWDGERAVSSQDICPIAWDLVEQRVGTLRKVATNFCLLLNTGA
jgi:hypothetical protein